MKKRTFLVLTLVFGTFLTVWPTQQADAYWGYRRGRRHSNYYQASRSRSRPRFSLSLAGGIHFVDTYMDDEYDDYSNSFTTGMLELGAHLWLNSVISLDLNAGAHITVNDMTGSEWGYVSFKPGIRIRFGHYYIRGALDLAISEEPDNRHNSTRRPFLFGFLLGVGLRVPVSRHVRLFAELDYQFLFSDIYYMPFYGQLGIEYVF